MASKTKTYSFILTISIVFITLLSIAVIGNTLYYFQSGADRTGLLNEDLVLEKQNAPYIRWLPDEVGVHEILSDGSKELIELDYLMNRHLSHLSNQQSMPIGLSDYYSHSAYQRLKERFAEKKPKYKIRKVDLTHHIKINFVSADGELVNFTDHGVLEKARIHRRKSRQKEIGILSQKHDLNVTMILDDGYWRIKNIKQQPYAGITYVDTSVIKENEGFITESEGSLFLNGKKFVPKGVNYYPQDSPWELFGDSFDESIIREDFSQMTDLGFNTVRIFIDYHLFQDSKRQNEYIAQLLELLDLAEESGLKVILTLFDFMGNFNLDNYTTTDRHAEKIVKSIHRHPGVLAIDIKNEPDIDYYHHHPENVKDWLDFIVDRVRIYDPNHLITIGYAYPENADFLHEKVDFVSFHSYRKPDELQSDITSLRDRLHGDKMILLEEFGKSTYSGIWNIFGSSEKAQKKYFEQVKEILETSNIPFVLWSWYDYETIPTKVVGYKPWDRAPQKKFGIIDKNGNPKSSVSVIID